MNKQQLREAYRQKRLGLSAANKQKGDDLLLIQFQKLVFEDVQLLLSYWPITGMVEPNTHLFSRYLLHAVPNFKLAYPVSDFKRLSMQAVFVTDETTYTVKSNNITEPKNGEIVDPQEIDMVFVPFLACDMQGYRVGYGKGFYDRFLISCREDTVKIGFSYFPPVEKIDDTAQFDIPLDYCITPQMIYEF